ncbi:MAG: family 43 glycosylhydrolase [Bacteroidales bacterium]|nr:family 43 glycosylhydrolase [Bacteroidales bacterium]
MNSHIRFLLPFMLILGACSSHPCSVKQLKSVNVKYEKVTGIGYEKGCTRRDPSDIIEVNGTWYIYYTKVIGRASGYWGTVWAAKSRDEGYSWVEIGEVLDKGESGAFDSQATFTPNILATNNKYYLYYTGVKPTPGRDDSVFENNSTNDFTAIGVAVSDNPEGPFLRISADPIIRVGMHQDDFDSYRVDDAVLIYRNKQYWLYYKGRSAAHGQLGPRHTKMGVAFANHPAGPYNKYERNPILDKSHEVLAWPMGPGIACLASFSSTIEYAPDGLDFTSNPLSVNVPNRPNAPGLFRPDLTNPVTCGEIPVWGISMVHNGPECYLQRFELLISLQQ